MGLFLFAEIGCVRCTQLLSAIIRTCIRRFFLVPALSLRNIFALAHIDDPISAPKNSPFVGLFCWLERDFASFTCLANFVC